MDHVIVEKAAGYLREAQENHKTCQPVRNILPEGDIETAYAVQMHNTEYALQQERKISGRKIGLTSEAVQKQLGVDQPDYGILFKDMACNDGEEVRYLDVLQPRIEAEIVLVLDKDLTGKNISPDDVANATAYAVPALEIVGSRIKDWDITIVDTIADNASCGLYVLGDTRCKLDDIDIVSCKMNLSRSGETVSEGSGAACMGNPLNAAAWVANVMAKTDYPLRAGDIILTGALGPMVEVNPGDAFESTISGMGTVAINFSK